MTDEDQPFVSRRALADLADAGYSVLRRPSMQVNFEVHHVLDRPGYLFDVLKDNESSGAARGWVPDGWIRETLSSAGYGGGLVVLTRSGPVDPEIRQRQQGSSAPAELKVDRDKPGVRVFRGSAVPNPTFLYDSASFFEGVVCIDNEPRMPQFRHGQATREVLAFIAEIAREQGGPILTLQTPVQLPPHRHVGADVRERTEEWPRSHTFAVRFALSIQHMRANTRLEVAKRVAGFCGQRGYGFWLRDSRPGYKTGNWFIIREHDRPMARRYVRSLAYIGPESQVVCALPITFIGPARVGSTASILKFLSTYPSSSVLSCSVTSLDDLAFIHLQLALYASPAHLAAINQRIDREMRGGTEDSDEIVPFRTPPTEALPRLIPLVVADKDEQISPDGDVIGELAARAGNYQSLAGPAFAIAYKPALARRPIWFTWQADGSDRGLASPLFALESALELVGLPAVRDEGGLGASIEYLVCREMQKSTLHGKGKLSVPLEAVPAMADDSSAEARASHLASRLEDAWRSELDGGVSALSVAWRENWLGHRLD